mmetsp:Transcript_7792/g.11597  ORF Transcript_7792/g.11597 Transcript_7792/m.11597 type:complete len:107 (-) Transcript_7792:1308-1628(-)
MNAEEFLCLRTSIEPRIVDTPKLLAYWPQVMANTAKMVDSLDSTEHCRVQTTKSVSDHLFPGSIRAESRPKRRKPLFHLSGQREKKPSPRDPSVFDGIVLWIYPIP